MIYVLRVTAMGRAMKLLRWRSDTIAKSLLFCRVATIIFINRWLGIYEQFEDIKQVIRSHKSTGQAKNWAVNCSFYCSNFSNGELSFLL
jgi:hypothetical protein